MECLGIKVVDSQNWLEPDPVYRGHYGSLTILGVEDRTLERWLKPILAPALNENVPREILCLFETARSAMVYGLFHYPLCTLASQQLYRVLEAAVSYAYKTLGASDKNTTFKVKTDWLIQKGIIPDETLFWDNIRYLRNESSHPEFQTVYQEHHAVRTLKMAAQRVNNLISAVAERKDHFCSQREQDLCASEFQAEES